jgi:hypothetical protein
MAKKALKTPNNNNGVWTSTQVKYPVQILTYDGFLAHHYVYMVLETTWNQARNEIFKVHEMEQLY